MAEPNRPKGYVPRYNEALLGDLPEEYKKYIEPPTITDTITPKESVFVAGTDVAEEGSAEAGEVKKKRERKIVTKRTERVAQVASDRFARGDAVAALFAQVEKDPEQAKRAKYYAPFKDSFREDLEEEAEEYPLVKYMDGQKAIEERPQYKLDTQVYMPSSRKAFYSFIQQTYAKEFNLLNPRWSPSAISASSASIYGRAAPTGACSSITASGRARPVRRSRRRRLCTASRTRRLSS